MVSSTLARGLLTLALGFASQAEAACTRPITARSGDTCASLADLAGITVTQFLRSNPSVTSCEALIPGATYCAEGTADAPPSAPPAPVSTANPAPTRSSIAPTSVPSGGPLKVSTDGSCGAGVTCAGSRFGTCCSAHGFCGSSADYCGEGCQSGLGACDSDTSSPPISQPPQPPQRTTPPPGVATTTTTITATIFVTNTVAETTGTTTSTVLLTSTAVNSANVTSTIIQSSTAITTATSTVRATVIITSTIFQTSTILSNVTRTQTATSVAVSTSTSTAWRTSLTIITRTVQVTSVEVDTLTTLVTSTFVRQVTSTATATVTSTRVVTSATVVCDQPNPTFIIETTPTFIIGPPPTTWPGGGGGIITTITQVQPPPARPSPVLPGSPSNCKAYDRILNDDTCRTLATRNGISLRDFYKLNPSVSSSSLGLLGSLLCTPDLLQLLLSGLCQIDCDNLWAGYYVCTGQ